jgi:hypothetical protein
MEERKSVRGKTHGRHTVREEREDGIEKRGVARLGTIDMARDDAEEHQDLRAEVASRGSRLSKGCRLRKTGE